MLSCEEGGTPPRHLPAGRAVVLNEIDYDQVGTDGDGFVELRNNGAEAADLAGLALVLVDGSDRLEYDRETLTGTLASGAHLAVAIEAQNGSPDGVALVDTGTGALLDALSYEGAITAAQIGTVTVSLVEGTGAAGVGRRLEHRRRLAQPQPERSRHGRRGIRLGVHDHRHARCGERRLRLTAGPAPRSYARRPARSEV